MTRRSLFAIRPVLREPLRGRLKPRAEAKVHLAIRPVLREPLRGRLKPRAEAKVHLAPGRLDRGELRMAGGARLSWPPQSATAAAGPDCASP
jgi:hypothetical protein